MLEHTLAALVAMDYPHETWVLDEGDSRDVRELCYRLGARHFSRKGLAKYQTGYGPFAARTKHGNYNAWLDAVGFASYDVVVSFDPDHVPATAYLERVLAYFADSSVGYVQPPQAYYNQRASFIARGAAEETYAYYSSIQMANYTLGHPIVTGCHTAHRVTALKSVGGFAPHEADDLLITLLYRAAGWRGVYVPEILARGLTPVDWKGYLAQQRRWARSVLDVKFRAYPRLAPSLPWRERVLGLMHGVYYLRSTGNVLGLVALLFLLVSGRAPQVLSWTGAGYALPLVAALLLLDAYRQRSDVRAVIHAHPPLAIALTVAGLPLDADVLPEVIYSVGIVPTAPYVTPGTADGQRAVRELVQKHDAILLDHHGTLTVGANVMEAYMRLERIEHSAAILLAARQVGELKRLPRAEFEKLCALGVCARQTGRHQPACLMRRRLVRRDEDDGLPAARPLQSVHPWSLIARGDDTESTEERRSQVVTVPLHG